MKKTNSKKIRISKKRSNLLTGVVIYIVFIAILAAYALQNLNTVWSKANDGINQPTTKDLLAILLIWLSIYLIRGIVLLLPLTISKWKGKLQGNGWIYGGILAALPAEIFLIVGLLSLVFKQGCETNGDFDCGWDGVGLIAPLFYSCVLQIFGMFAGSLIRLTTNKNRRKR
jgi:uncharacterized BrkB/YihY/UPF0761 family membrane protein